jgi:glyoxylase-like metal-dependent hydrolase (beta-lactamase superfamily II)/rhodanese-related sulfurtransferase
MDPESSTYTYLLADGGNAVLIDPVFEQARRDAALLDELALTLRYTLETHVHADHVTGAWLHRQRCGSRISLARVAGAEGADVYLNHGDRIFFGNRYLTARSTPGHTNGCVTYVLDDESCAFTGDALLIRGAGRTDFQEGDPATLYRSVHLQIFTLPEDCLLYPGHDYRGISASSVGEEKRHNTRLGGALSEGDFVGYMDNLNLPYPQKLDVAVPANLKCGEPVDLPQDNPEWAPLKFTFAGIWEIEPNWVAEHLDDLQVVDVREPDEFAGPLGRIPGALLAPLDQLCKQPPSVDSERPIVTVCRAGGRSAHASNVLKKAGFSQVANLPGGMLRWRALHLPVEGGAD